MVVKLKVTPYNFICMVIEIFAVLNIFQGYYNYLHK